MPTLFQTPPRAIHYIILCGIAFLLRALFFGAYIQYENRYSQPDSFDYHLGGWCLRQNVGFRKPDGRPQFWRTPGYPYFLSFFYEDHNRTLQFEQHKATHLAALWTQIALCSTLPLFAGLLAQVLTASPPVIWITAIAATVHIGYILASTYLLTDGLAAILFIIFLSFLFSVIRFRNESSLSISNLKTLPSINHPYTALLCAAFFLATYTWMRPMGQFIGIVSTILITCSAGPWRTTLLRAVWFMTIFAMLLMPWFIRNHRWTDSWFFCPLFGLYLNVFNAPKILARTENIPLQEAHARLQRDAHVLVLEEHQKLLREKSKKVVCGENICARTAWPIVKAHPWLFLYDWMTEVIKTTFDLYAYQLTALANNCFAWDPLIEYLPEKLYDCLYHKPMPVGFRLIAWLELLCAIIIWLAIFAGTFYFLLLPILRQALLLFHSYGYLWLKCGLFIGVTICQTGGFGYARLRLPIELLMIILCAAFWLWIYRRIKYETPIRSVAR